MTVGAILAIGFGGLFILTRAASPQPLSDEATSAAAAAGCTPLETPVGDAPGGQHLQAGEPFTYDDTPATSGFHDPSPLPDTPRVYGQPVAETQAVHTLEHGGVIAYYRLPGEGGVAQDVVDGLAALAPTLRATYVIPYASFSDDEGFAVTAWNKRIVCPGGITADQASTLVQGFEQAYACSSNAPEGTLADGC